MGATVLVSAGCAFWFIRRRLFYTPSKQRPFNVIQDEEDGNGENYWHDLHQEKPHLLASASKC